MPGIHIVKDERECASEDVCENCGHRRRGRRVEEIGFIARESRGFRFICFECFGPRIFWYEKGTKHQKIYESPVEQLVASR